jgi:hypothetical protein
VGGALLSPLEWLSGQIGWLKDITGKMAADTPMAKLMVGWGGKLVDTTWNFLIDKAKSWIGSLVSGVGSFLGIGGGNNKQIVQAAANAYGWGGGAEWAALDWLLQHESGWSNTAQNPTSTAYGLFQFLNGTWGSVGATKTSDPAGQAAAGLKYIKQRYGDPINANAFWGAHHWFDTGGTLPPGPSLVYNGTGGPEDLFTADQMAGAATYGGGGGALIGSLTMTVPQGTSAAGIVDELSFALRHTRRGVHARR